MGAVAAVLAAPAPTGDDVGTTALVLEPLLRASGSPEDALSLLTRPPWVGHVAPEVAPIVISLLRARRVRQVAHEYTDLIAEAVDAERDTGGTVAERDARAAAALMASLPLWPAELTGLVRRERRRRTAEAVAARLDAIVAAATEIEADLVRDSLASDDVGPAEVDAAMGAAPVPPGVEPEDFEDDSGRSRLWPPHADPVPDLRTGHRARLRAPGQIPPAGRASMDGAEPAGRDRLGRATGDGRRSRRGPDPRGRADRGDVPDRGLPAGGARDSRRLRGRLSPIRRGATPSTHSTRAG